MAERHFEHGHQALGRLMEEEPLPDGLLDFFRCLFGRENWRSKLPAQAIADAVDSIEIESQPEAGPTKLTQPGPVAAAGPN